MTAREVHRAWYREHPEKQKQYVMKMRKKLLSNPNDPRHGTQEGYRLGCRCEPCKKANLEYSKRHRESKLAEMEADTNHPKHGTYVGYYYGCRCDACRHAKSEYNKKLKGLNDEQ